jgi:hypothetical protein
MELGQQFRGRLSGVAKPADILASFAPESDYSPWESEGRMLIDRELEGERVLPESRSDDALAQYPAMVKDAKENGIREAVWLHAGAGEVWDGHHRLRVAEKYGLDVPWERRDEEPDLDHLRERRGLPPR